MRTGLFLSRNHGRISAAVDVDKLAGLYSDLDVVRIYDHFFGENEQHDILKQVDDHKLEAIVLAGNSTDCFLPDRQGAVLLELLNGHGINPNRVSVANIDGQVAMVHAAQNDRATEKAGLLIDVALAKVRHCHAVATLPVVPHQAVLVIGTTAGAVIAANALIEKNQKVFLMEKNTTWRCENIRGDKFETLLARVKSHPDVEILPESDLAAVAGWCGEYDVDLSTVRGSVKITVGAILLCLGDDVQWIGRLRPKMRLDVDEDGLLAGNPGAEFMGRTKDPGILFIPFKSGSDQLKAEALDARAAVGLLAALLNQPRIDHPVLVSEVDETLCGGCATCIKTCAFSASSIDGMKKTSVIDLLRCVGCGNCVTACPTGARDLSASPVQYMFSAIDILSKGAVENGEPRILALLCKNSGYPAADAAGDPAGQNYSPGVLPLRVECAGNIDTLYILRAFQKGFDGIALVICKDGHCHNIVGNTDMERRLGLFRAVLRSRGIDDNRMRIIHIAPREGRRLNAELQNFSADLKAVNRL